MENTIWVIQLVLAVMYFTLGIRKISQTQERIAQEIPWVAHLSLPAVRMIGLVEIICSIGLVGPDATGFYPFLAHFAAIFLAIIMISSIAYHLKKGDYRGIYFNYIMLIASILVAYFRKI